MPRVTFVYPPYSSDPQDLMNQDPFNVSRMDLPKSATTIKSKVQLPIAIPPPPGDIE
ncbi:hypothetical protein CY34DRAFT_807932 [Suillus luteus UH-Slu-Lm8-n1]|uniref:Uncharacterized protein n=1 Tax=Suillus luteus UH-Slu-Lm8-n1 TaxID=930992 RepID=A0A0D0AZJ0_9AGAM|nr:hypothetical protein CY34DRAFT_807932 [Suillus luteus UH-Slu-Lm8-n1]